jgi:MFS family permease
VRAGKADRNGRRRQDVADGSQYRTNLRMIASNWRLILVLLLAGVVAAFQIGKAAVGLPLIRQDLGLDLLTASLIISAYVALAAVVAFPAGLLIARRNRRDVVIVGLLIIATGSFLGATANHPWFLLATRVFEGLGFIAVAIAAPALMRSLANPGDRAVALALWGVYLPAGSALMMLLGPLVVSAGWQMLWIVNGVVAAAHALVVWRIVPASQDAHTDNVPISIRDALRTLAVPAPALLALVFGLYTFQYLAIAGLLPTLLVERLGLSVAAAGTISALTVVANALGNLSASVLLHLGAPLWSIIAAAFACMGVASLGIFADAPPLAVAGLAALSLAVTGLVPASIYAATPGVAPSPALLAVMVGLLVQAANIGHLLGPVVLGAWADRWGWSSAPLVFGTVAISGIGAAFALRHLLRKDRHDRAM